MVVILAQDEKKYVQKAFTKGIKHLSIESIDMGDIIVGKYIIERKQINDLFKSAIDGSLFNQLYNIQQFCLYKHYVGVLLVEGWKVKNPKLLKITNKQELMVNALDHFDVVPIQTNSLDETVKLVNELHNTTTHKASAIRSVRAYKRKKSLKQEQQFFLQGLPLIGEKKSERIMAKYSNIMEYLENIVENQRGSKLYNILTKEMH